jgi:hypothetical protein
MRPRFLTIGVEEMPRLITDINKYSRYTFGIVDCVSAIERLELPLWKEEPTVWKKLLRKISSLFYSKYGLLILVGCALLTVTFIVAAVILWARKSGIPIDYYSFFLPAISGFAQGFIGVSMICFLRAGNRR